MFGGKGNSKRRCWYMHFKSSLVPHPQLKLVIKFGNLKRGNAVVLGEAVNGGALLGEDGGGALLGGTAVRPFQNGLCQP